MTERQLLYQFNCRQSIKLCKEMELLIEYADYQEKLLNYESRETAILRYKEIKLELDGIWDMQVVLFYEIQEEFKKHQRDNFAEIMKVPKRRSSYRTPFKDY